MTILNFDVLIGVEATDSAPRYTVRVVESTHGRTDSAVIFPLNPVSGGFQVLNGTPPSQVIIPPDLDPASLAAITSIENVGTSLYRALTYDDRVQDILNAALAAARSGGDQIRLRFQIEPGALRRLAVELLRRDPEGYLAIAPDLSITRYVAVEGMPIRTLITPSPLNLLIVTAAPTDLPSLNADVEIGRIREAVQPLVDQGLVTVHELRDPSLSALRTALVTHRIAVLHFIGHGDYSGDRPVLAFTQPDKTLLEVDAETFAYNANVDTLRLAVMNACDTANESTTAPLLGIAPKLMQRANLPAVIAMNSTITDGSAIAFSAALYEGLANGTQIDDAVREGRLAIYNRQAGKSTLLMREFALPVLFLRPANAQLIDFPARQRERIIAAADAQSPDAMQSQIARQQYTALAGAYTRLANWKTLHDLLQTLDSAFDLTEKEVQQSAARGDLRFVFNSWSFCLAQIERLRAFATDPRTVIVVTPLRQMVDDTVTGDPWSAGIIAQVLRFDKALNTGDALGLTRAARGLRQTIHTQLNATNKALVDTNRGLMSLTLPLNVDPAAAERNEFIELHRRLDERVMLHDVLQDVTTAFRRLRDEVSAPADQWELYDIESAWDYTRSAALDSRLFPFADMFGALVIAKLPTENGTVSGDPYAVELYTASRRIDAAIDAAVAVSATSISAATLLTDAVRTFDQALRKHTYLADKQLHDLTSELRALADQLVR